MFEEAIKKKDDALQRAAIYGHRVWNMPLWSDEEVVTCCFCNTLLLALPFSSLRQASLFSEIKIKYDKVDSLETPCCLPEYLLAMVRGTCSTTSSL